MSARSRAQPWFRAGVGPELSERWRREAAELEVDLGPFAWSEGQFAVAIREWPKCKHGRPVTNCVQCDVEVMYRALWNAHPVG